MHKLEGVAGESAHTCTHMQQAICVYIHGACSGPCLVNLGLALVTKHARAARCLLRLLFVFPNDESGVCDYDYASDSDDDEDYAYHYHAHRCHYYSREHIRDVVEFSFRDEGVQILGLQAERYRAGSGRVWPTSGQWCPNLGQL